MTSEIASKMEVALAISPAGREVIAVTFGGSSFYFFKNISILGASSAQDFLKTTFGVATTPGLPFDLDASIKNRKLITKSVVEDHVVGLFVPADNYDSLLDKVEKYNTAQLHPIDGKGN